MSCYCCYDREDRSTISWDEEEEAARWTVIQDAWDNYKRDEEHSVLEQEHLDHGPTPEEQKMWEERLAEEKAFKPLLPIYRIVHRDEQDAFKPLYELCPTSVKESKPLPIFVMMRLVSYFS